MSLGRLAPYNECVWTPLAAPLGADFGGYFVWSRPAITPAPPWRKIAEYVPASYETPATIEQQLLRFNDYQAGWGAAAGPWPLGWDYYIEVLNRKTGYRSRVGGQKDVRNAPTPDDSEWLTSNLAPYLNCPVDSEELDGSQVEDPTTVHKGFLGRHGAYTTTQLEREGREYKLSWEYLGPSNLSEERARWPVAMAAAGRQVSLLMPRGERVIGTLHAVKPKQTGSRLSVELEGEFAETAEVQLLSPYNLPAGVVLNGTTQYATTPHNAAFNPGTGPFTIVLAFAQNGWVLNKEYLSKYDTSGYEFWATGTTNNLQFFVSGAAAHPQEANAVWYDNRLHVAVGTSSGNGAGDSRKLYRDGALVDTKTGAYTSVAGVTALVAGANPSGGVPAPFDRLQSWAVYDRELTPDEALAATGWLSGWHGFRMPGGAVGFYDRRDDRCGGATATVLHDLASNSADASLVGSPVTRGRPWELQELDVLASDT